MFQLSGHIMRNLKKNRFSQFVTSIIVLLAILIMLTASISGAQSSGQLRVNDEGQVPVQTGNAIWAQTFGGPADDRAFNAIPDNGGYLVVGSTKSIGSNMEGWAIKLDEKGSVMWNRTYLEGQGTEFRAAINLTDGYLFVGNMFTVSGDENGYVVQTDSNGTPVWHAVIGGQKTDKFFHGYQVGDGYVVLGVSDSYDNHNAAWMVKIGGTGNIVWNKTFSGSADSAFRSGVYAFNGNYVAAGYEDLLGDGNYDFSLYEINTAGDTVWNKTYGGSNSEKAYSMTQASDGYVLVGEQQSTETATDAWVLKVDKVGTEIWDKKISGPAADSPSYITCSHDGGYLVAGFTFSFGAGQRDFWFFKMNAQGQVQFSGTYGNQAFQEAYSIIETNDNAYVLAGWTDPLDQPDIVGRATYDFYVVKLSAPSLVSENGLPYLQIIEVAVAFTVLLATLLLVFRFRSNKKK